MPVEVKAVEGEVGDDPFRYFAHVFVFNEEVAGSAPSPADEGASLAVFAGGVLIELRSNPPGDVPAEFDRGKAVGKSYRAKVFDHRVEHLRSKIE